MACDNHGLLVKPTHGRLIFYKLMTLVPVTTVVIGIGRHADSLWWLAGYFGIFLTHFSIIYTNKCPYCPYYKTDSKIHRCFMIWGVPKIRKAQSGQAPKFLKHYVPFAMLVMVSYPIYWLRFEWELLVLYLLSIVVLVSSIMLQECSRCTYFECGNNSVPEEIRKAFNQQSP